MSSVGRRLVEVSTVETVGDVVRRVASVFAAAGLDTAALDARLLVGAALCLDQVALIGAHRRELTPSERQAIDRVTDRRLAREPVSRILGRRWFWGLDLEIGPATLDPRPETETLVAGVLHRLAERSLQERQLRIVDLGTGSGAILIALLSALPRAAGLAVDIDDAALAIARRNAIRHGVGDRMDFQKSDWFSAISAQRFDVIVANPPYISSGDIPHLAPEVAGFDPRSALDGGADGLGGYRTIVSRASEFLVKEGLLALEIGLGQGLAVRDMMIRSGNLRPESPSDLWRDLSGHERCVAGRAR